MARTTSIKFTPAERSGAILLNLFNEFCKLEMNPIYLKNIEQLPLLIARRYCVMEHF